MKDIPMFTTETGVSTLVLKEVPYKQIAYVTVRDVQPGGLREHLGECVSFCRMCGAEQIFAAGHPELEEWPLHCAVIPMALSMTDQEEPDACLFPVTEATVGRWRELYNKRLASVDNAATMTAYDEKEIVSSRGAYFIHDCGDPLGIGWIKGSEILVIASLKQGAGERVLRALLTVADSDRVTLEVASTNRRAIRLYEKLGFLPSSGARSWYKIY